MRLRPLPVTALAALVALVAPVATAAPARAAPAAQDTQALERTALDPAALAARDARISFSPDSAARARAALDSSPESLEDRAVAALALASARATGDLSRLEILLAGGRAPEQRAALFALGDMGPAGWGVLDTVAQGDLDDGEGRPAGLADALAVALVAAERAGAPGARRLTDLAAGEGEAARLAREGLALLRGEVPRALGVALAQRYELRWRAAKAYGLVDGRLWRKAQAREWFADEDFLDRVVLAAAADLPEIELRTHLYEMLLRDERPGVLRVAAIEMPDELVHAHESGAWAPSVAGWHAILDEIDVRRKERDARALVELAFDASPELEPLAGLLMLRAGGEIPWRWVVDRLERGTDEERRRLVEAVGDRGEPARIAELSELLTARRDLGLEATGLVALARLGHPPATVALDAYTRAAASEERDAALTALAHALHDKKLRPLAQKALDRDDLPLALRLDLELGLALTGERVERELLRRTLPFAAQDDKRFLVVRALAERPDEEDLAALASVFPFEEDADLNVELALALLRHRHPAMKGCLTAALWGSAWNRSILAGGLVYEALGLRGLVEELNAPPRSASEHDLRRVGFALGEWGGLAAVEELARTHKEGDPELQGAFLGALSSRAGQASAPQRSTLVLPSRVRITPPPPGGGAGAPQKAPGAGGFPGRKKKRRG